MRPALLLLLAACGAAPPDPEPAVEWSIETAHVLFTARRGGVTDLHVLDVAAGETTPLTSFAGTGAGANAARVSPDGARIAYQVVRGGNYDIQLMDLDGGPEVLLVDHPEYDVAPTWSPDGSEIGFMSTRGFVLGELGPFPGHVYVVDVPTGALRQVTQEPLTSALGPSDWSADGRSMLIARESGAGLDVFELDVATGAERRITNAPESEYSAAYAHDGRRITFHAEGADASQIVVCDLDGGNRRVVTRGPGYRYSPRWSPDDRWVLFTASEGGEQYDVRAVRVGDGTVVDVVATPEDERDGTWLERSPGGG